jgi:negative regulator of replication initiation
MMDFELEMEVSTKDRLNVQAKADSEHILEAIRDEIEDFRDELMSENFRFKAEMLKEFMQMRVI